MQLKLLKIHSNSVSQSQWSDMKLLEIYYSKAVVSKSRFVRFKYSK